jgi:nicotinamide-nucleotide amidase
LGKTVALAESCTGGLLANRITNVPGASRVLLEGMVTYSNEAKIRSLGVPEILIAAHGAVSEPVARAMAEGAAARSGADYGIGITGIAGTDGGTPEKPTGTVFVAVSERDAATECPMGIFPDGSRNLKQLASQLALNRLRRAGFLSGGESLATVPARN